jgi:uncharacterized protein YutE (UPF0331/DUF86 family)
MSLEVNNRKLNLQEMQSTSEKVGGSASTTSGRTGNNPINLKLDIDLPKEFLEELKNLTEEEQLNKLKTKFPEFPVAELQSLITYVNSQSEVSNNKALNTQDYEINNTPENEAKKSKLELAIEKYIQETGLKDDIDIDGIIAQLKTKSELTDEEQEILDLFNSKPKADVNDAKWYMSKEFKKLSTEEKLNKIVENFLNNTDENFPSMTDEDKQAYIENQKDILVNFAANREDVKKYQDKNDKVLVASTAILAKIAQEEGISIEELTKMQAEELNKKVTEQENNAIKSALSLISKDELQSIPYSQRVDKYADAILSMTDDKYANIKGEKERQKIRNEYIDKFITEQLGNTEWDKVKNDPIIRDHALQRMAIAVEQIVENIPEGGSITKELESYAQRSPIEKNAVNIRYLREKQPQTQKDRNLLEQFELEDIIYGQMKEDGIEKPTPEQFLIYSKKVDASKLSKTQQDYLGKMQKEAKRMIDLGADKENLEPTHTISQEMQISEFTGTKEEYIAKKLNGINPENIDKNYTTLKQLLLSIDDAGDIETIRNQLLAQGVSQEKVNDLLSDTKFWVKAHCRADDAHDQSRLIELSKEYDIAAADKVSQDVVRCSSKWYKKDEDVAVIGNTAINHDDLIEPFSIGVHTYRDRESAAGIFKAVATSDGHSDASLAKFSNTFIKTANSDEDRLYHAQRAAEIKSPAVLEGVASASKYVTDSKIKASYTNVVTDAAKQYSTDVQKTISTALETGKISEQTLAKTTVSEKAESTKATQTQDGKAQAQQTGQAETSNKATTNQATAQTPKSVTAAQQPNVVANNASTTKPATVTPSKTSGVSGLSTGVTSPASIKPATTSSSSLYADSEKIKTETDALEDEKQATLGKLERLRDKISNAVDEWNKKHQNKISEADEEVIEEIAEAIEDETDEIEEPSKEESSTTKDSTQKVIQTAIEKASSIGEIYDILVSNLGETKIREKFIEALASSSSDKIKSFISSKSSDPNIVKELYEHCSSKNIKQDLIRLMGDDTVKELLSTDKIKQSDYGNVPHKILFDYIRTNPKLYVMNDSDFNNLKNFLTKDEFEYLNKLRNGEDGFVAQETERQKNVSGAKTKKAPKTDVAKDLLGNEKQNTLTNKKATAANVEGAPIGMNDPVLTPGSNAWARKYGKQATSSFTMAALEQDDVLGIGRGSTTVSSTKFIDGKTRAQKKGNFYWLS